MTMMRTALGGYSYTQIDNYCGLHFTTVGRVVCSNKANGLLWELT